MGTFLKRHEFDYIPNRKVVSHSRCDNSAIIRNGKVEIRVGFSRENDFLIDPDTYANHGLEVFVWERS